MTYSIIACDTGSGALGVAIQSFAFGTAAACSYAHPGVGAIATQSFTNRSYGPRGLQLLAIGTAPEDVVATLTSDDSHAAFRQLAVVSSDGRTAVWTGEESVPFAGHIQGSAFSVQGNMLRNPDVCRQMAETYAEATGTLAQRMLATLRAGESAGGNFRGSRSAGLVIVDAKAPDAPPVVDLRVEASAEPIEELGRLVALAEADRGALPCAAGVPEADERLWAAVASARTGDIDTAVRTLEPLADSNPQWIELVERLERLGNIPIGIAQRLRDHDVPALPAASSNGD